jgi:probable dihydroxyacetone kinase regulator
MRQKGGDMSQITKKAIEASLKNLLLKKPFDKITINDIAEDCGISRMTFYYHFKDIYDLVEWACEEDVKKILEDKDDYKTWTQGFLNLFEEVLKNKPFILNVYRSVGREQVENYLYKIVYDLLLNVIEEKAQGMTVRDEDKEFVADFYKYAFVGLMLDWVKNGMKEDPHKIVKKVEFLLSGSLSVSLERFRTGRISSKTDK